MSGILEQMNAAVQAHAQEIAALKAAVAALQAGASAAPAPAAPAMGLGGFSLGTPAPATPPATPQYPPATGEEIVALITPYVENQQIKEALGVEMRAMGINALPETQAHQYPELMHRFKGVITRFQQAAAAGAAAAAPAAAAPLSLV